MRMRVRGGVQGGHRGAPGAEGRRSKEQPRLAPREDAVGKVTENREGRRDAGQLALTLTLDGLRTAR